MKLLTILLLLICPFLVAEEENMEDWPLVQLFKNSQYYEEREAIKNWLVSKSCKASRDESVLFILCLIKTARETEDLEIKHYFPLIAKEIFDKNVVYYFSIVRTLYASNGIGTEKLMKLDVKKEGYECHTFIGFRVGIVEPDGPSDGKLQEEDLIVAIDGRTDINNDEPNGMEPNKVSKFTVRRLKKEILEKYKNSDKLYLPADYFGLMQDANNYDTVEVDIKTGWDDDRVDPRMREHLSDICFKDFAKEVNLHFEEKEKCEKSMEEGE